MDANANKDIIRFKENVEYVKMEQYITIILEYASVEMDYNGINSRENVCLLVIFLRYI